MIHVKNKPQFLPSFLRILPFAASSLFKKKRSDHFRDPTRTLAPATAVVEQINEQDTEKQGKEHLVTGFASTENVIEPY